MNFNNKKVITVGLVIMGIMLIILVVFSREMSIQNKIIKDTKAEMDLKNSQIDYLEDKADSLSEIEIIKQRYEENKIDIITAKEKWGLKEVEVLEAKSVWENKVWLERCLEEKLVDTEINCEENLERFADWGAN